MRNVFFTSDTHFGSMRTIELSKRPFSSIKDCDNEMIHQFNKLIKSDNDIIYHLGDFGIYDNVKFLNGKVILIWGNYELKEFYELYDNEIKVIVDDSFHDEFQRYLTDCARMFKDEFKNFSPDFPENYWRFVFDGAYTISEKRKNEFKNLVSLVNDHAKEFSEEIKKYGFEDVIDFNGLNINLIHSRDRKKKLLVHVQHEPIDCLMHKSVTDYKFDMCLFGHIHGRQLIKNFGIDVGVDGHHFKPVSKDDVFFYNNALNFYDINVFV